MRLSCIQREVKKRFESAVKILTEQPFKREAKLFTTVINPG